MTLTACKAATRHQYLRPGFGYAMQFVDMNEETAGRLEEALEQLQDRAPYDE
jgi:hypothetical protein